MNNKTVESKDSLPAKKPEFNEAEARKIASFFDTEYLPKRVLMKLDNAFSDFNKCEGDKKKESEVKLLQVASDAMIMMGVENNIILGETILPRYRSLVVEFTGQIIKEYDCKTYSEKSLAQAVAQSYARIIQFASKLNDCLDIEYLSSQKTGYYGMIGKELDRANRHFLASLGTLKQLKQPELKVNIKTNTAFVAENQQFNGGDLGK